jgi:putative spermidine/putrescine transport system permease protein
MADAARLRSIALRLFCALVIAFLLMPVVVVVLASFTATSYLTIPPKGLTLGWYAKVLDDPDYVGALLLSLRLAAVATLGSLVLGTAAAYAFTRRRVPASALVSALMMSPLIFPGVVIGVALLQYYTLIGIRGSFLGLVLAHLVITLPYTVRTVLANLAGTDPEIEAAARTLGAGAWSAFRQVTLPLIRPGLMAGGLFAFITSFDNVPVTIFLTGAAQNTLPVKIFTAIEFGVDPSIAALSTMLIAGTALFLVAAERWIGIHRFA